MIWFYGLFTTLFVFLLILVLRLKTKFLDFLNIKNLWQYAGVTLAATLLINTLVYCIAENSDYIDHESRGYFATKTRYTEYWETWVKKTCSRQKECGYYYTGTGRNRVRHTKYCTEYYDCSYCDKNPESYEIILNNNSETGVEKEKYAELKSRWKSVERFVDQDRNINRSHGCGIDGDVYEVDWDKSLITSENVTLQVPYVYKKKNHNSGLRLHELDSSEIKANLIYDYPKQTNDKGVLKQSAILGLEKLKLRNTELDSINKFYDYLNALGEKTYCRLFIMLYPDKDINNSILQERYLQGGARNEVILTIGYNSKTNELNWVRAFGPSENKIVYVNLREDLMEHHKQLDLLRMYGDISRIIRMDFKPEDSHKYDYVETEEPVGKYIAIILISFLIPVISIIIVKNIEKN